MGTVLIILMMLFSFKFLDAESLDTYDEISPKCGTKGPNIIRPFSYKDQNCGYPGFKLTCQQNQTVIHFPSYGDLVVKSVSYDTKKLNLLDPKNCVHEVFLNLDLSGGPLDYYYVLKNYSYVNCSARLSHMFDEVPCLSAPHYHVYVVESAEELPSFCSVMKTKGIPFAYSPYLSDNSFGLGFTWDLTGYIDCEVKEECFNPLLGRVAGFILIILLAAILISVKTYCSRAAWDYSVANLNEVKGQKLNYYFGSGNDGNDKEFFLHNQNKSRLVRNLH